MTARAPDDPLPLTRRVNDACERFEAAWRAGERPALEDELRGWDGPDRLALFAELLPLERELRAAAGEAPAAADYLGRKRAKTSDDLFHST